MGREWVRSEKRGFQASQGSEEEGLVAVGVMVAVEGERGDEEVGDEEVGNVSLLGVRVVGGGVEVGVVKVSSSVVV